jgi:Uma2 family endonuclease
LPHEPADPASQAEHAQRCRRTFAELDARHGWGDDVVDVVAKRALRYILMQMLEPGQISPDTARPISRVEYDKMVQIGLFEDEHVELLEGVVVRMSPQGAKHAAVVQRLTHLLVLALGQRAAVRIQSSFAASDGSQPEPDVAVVPPGDYDDAHPSEAWLVVEVSETSLVKDRGLKARLYAETGVPEYWVVNAVDDIIEVHSEIVRGAYARVVPYRKGDVIDLQRFPQVNIRVDDVLR